jgi:hypothetical protein
MKLSPRVGVGQGAVMDWARILAYVTGTADQELLAVPVSQTLTQRGNVSGMLVLESRSERSKRSSRRAVPWTRSPKSTSSISMILPLRRPTASMACTRNLPSQMNHDTIL